MKNLLVIGALLLLNSTLSFGELTQADLQAIREIVKQEVSLSESRINGEIAVLKIEVKRLDNRINDVHQRLDDMHGLLVALFATIGILIILATAMTYLASKIGAIMPMIKDTADMLNTLFRRMDEERQGRIDSINRTDAQIAAIRDLEANIVEVTRAFADNARSEASAD